MACRCNLYITDPRFSIFQAYNWLCSIYLLSCCEVFCQLLEGGFKQRISNIQWGLQLQTHTLPSRSAPDQEVQDELLQLPKSAALPLCIAPEGLFVCLTQYGTCSADGSAPTADEVVLLPCIYNLSWQQFQARKAFSTLRHTGPAFSCGLP